ncbi:hypothetical protein [Arenibacter algicola]|uniref:hypothetical protein n=1 Tax=Arenibacter algicola TaxID=616991 RepID=UPI0004DF0C8A|nr:hypothetical protein [Arenibacter algicola]
MELDQFITTTIKSIIKSVNDTKEFAESNGAIINPVIMERIEDHDLTTSIWRKDGKDGRRSLTNIDFDVAVTASNEEESKIGGGLKIQVLNLGASTSENLTNETTSRIKFSLNVALPHQGDE